MMSGLKAAVARRAPYLATAASTYLQLRRQARSARRASGVGGELRRLAVSDQSDRLLVVPGFEDVRIDVGRVEAIQKQDELVPLLERIQALEPRRVCEIGTSTGGTLYLLTRVSHPEALLISIDLVIPPHAEAARTRMARPGQRVVSIRGNSQLPETRTRVEDLLHGEPLDVLFIDGDHSYEGVRRDFELYSPLVRSSGLIALHDINEDFATRHGVQTLSVSGDVPRFWAELKQTQHTEELIAEPEQDGYGIGVIYPGR
jgi:predicted O-methyltransferase YrrM